MQDHNNVRYAFHERLIPISSLGKGKSIEKWKQHRKEEKEENM